jgi:hypothetical protein
MKNGKLMGKILVTLLAIVCWQIHAQAQFIVAPYGNDILGNGGTSAPFATIQKAVDIAPVNGALIAILPGTYSGAGNHNINLEGKAVVIQSTCGSGMTTLDCQQNQAFIAHSTETTNTIIDGLTIINGFVQSGEDWGGAGIIDVRYGAAISVRNCVFTENITAADTTTTTAIIMAIDSTSEPILIYNCLFYGNDINAGGNGVPFAHILSAGGGLGASLQVVNCTIAYNSLNSYNSSAGNPILAIEGASTILGEIDNTIVWGNTPNGTGNISIYANTVAYSIADGLVSTNGQEFAINNSNPLFVNPASGDFSLANDSPAHNAGDPALPKNPDGSRSDIGWRADRFIGASIPAQQAHAAMGVATIVNGFVVGVNLSYPGNGYTNPPLVRFIGGGGIGAEAIAVVSNGMVTAVNVINAGYGYTDTPQVVIEPPFIPNPVLGIAPMSFLVFSNLTVGGNYQLQQSVISYWTNQPITFTATDVTNAQIVPGVARSIDYRLVQIPVPMQAIATPQVVNGFVVGANVINGGSGYVNNPAVAIIGGGGIHAAAIANVSGGVVTSITITNAGYGYINTPTIQIAPPTSTVVTVLPAAVLPVMRLDSASLAPYDNYQIQFKPDIGGTWGNWNGGLFSPTDVTNSQFLLITNGTGFFRLQYMP